MKKKREEMFAWDNWEQDLRAGKSPYFPKRNQPQQQNREEIENLFSCFMTEKSKTP